MGGTAFGRPPLVNHPRGAVFAHLQPESTTSNMLRITNAGQCSQAFVHKEGVNSTPGWHFNSDEISGVPGGGPTPPWTPLDPGPISPGGKVRKLPSSPRPGAEG